MSDKDLKEEIERRNARDLGFRTDLPVNHIMNRVVAKRIGNWRYDPRRDAYVNEHGATMMLKNYRLM